MKVNIQGLPKHQVLIALYENAKNSQWTYNTMAIKICNSHEPCITRYYQTEINDAFMSMVLTEEEAQTNLSANLYVDYIGFIAIKISFTEDLIDVSNYDKLHHNFDKSNRAYVEPVKEASDVINDLRKRLGISKKQEFPNIVPSYSTTEKNRLFTPASSHDFSQIENNNSCSPIIKKLNLSVDEFNNTYQGKYVIKEDKGYVTKGFWSVFDENERECGVFSTRNNMLVETMFSENKYRFTKSLEKFKSVSITENTMKL
ncbi:hypothetical protein Lsan_3493 [Legionella santicrucis]|uniref:Uncharacterized protein n=1 Tax=Legionella santicrucis TaxID=45074 RepID=A0A0W0YA93_9GAMM|nr:hypothetical protein [Legionella santicrucis]KTD53829.1 hypothetical protein Lsan_3493 [Legionella santicrucis]